MNSLQKVKELLTQEDKFKLYCLLIPMSLTAIVGSVSIGAIMPFIGVVVHPEMIQANVYLNNLYHYLSFANPLRFTALLGFAALIILVVANALSAATIWLSARITEGIKARLSNRLFSKYLDKPYGFHLQNNSSTLRNNLQLVNNVSQSYLQQGVILITQLISLLAILIFVVWVNPVMAFIMFVSIGGAYGLIYALMKQQLHTAGKLTVESLDKLSQLTTESFGGIKDIKLKQSAACFKALFYPLQYQYARSQSTLQVLGQVPRYAIEAILFGGVILLIVLMLWQRQSLDSVIPLLAMYVYSGYRLMPALSQIFTSISSIKGATDSVRQVYASLAVTDDDKLSWQTRQTTARITPMPFNHELKIKELCYHYPGNDNTVLNNINFTINHNEVVGVIGKTGSGKTTLVDILLGLLQPASGCFCVDGLAIKNLEQEQAWQKNLGYVPQFIFLADSTIAENIAFGTEQSKVDHAQVEACARIAALHEFIQTLPKQYNTLVGERGVRLSGGQIQRIGIARALYSNPSVLVLDEATSSLDTQTEQQVMQAIYNMKGKMTILIIAHRLSTVAQCDKIIMLSHGKIIDQGTMSELVQRHELMDSVETSS